MFEFNAQIRGRVIQCELRSSEVLPEVEFCFSLMAPAEVLGGGRLKKRVGGFHIVALPPLDADETHEVTLEYLDPNTKTTNRAWLPLGAYLRINGQVHTLPALELGVRLEPRALGEFCPELPLIPPPQKWRPSEGSFRAKAFCSDHPALKKVDELAKRNTLGPFLAPDGIEVLCTNQADLAEDAYVLKLTPEQIEISASHEVGFFYAAISLLSLWVLTEHMVPCGTIEDSPRFSWRGQHLDCARHFYKPNTILDLLDLMALLKLNKFHWHFSDDEAFRIEIPSLPELWHQTALRGEGHLVPAVFGSGLEAGGTYSLAEVQMIVDHASALHIDVLPEIEIPAHAFALTQVFPETRDPNDKGTEESVQGYGENVMNPACPKTWEVIEALLTDVIPLFPYKHVHLGCDELPDDAWAGSPLVDELMKTQALTTRDDVQGWMMEKAAQLCVRLGARPLAWEEAMRGQNGGIGHNAILMSWTGQEAGVKAAEAGYDVVMTPAQHVYLDMAQSDDPDDWGASWAAITALSNTINWDPVHPKATHVKDRILGVQGAFWGEFTQYDEHLYPMIAPRILGVATKAWEEFGKTKGPELSAQADAYRKLFKAMNWASAPV